MEELKIDLDVVLINDPRLQVLLRQEEAAAPRRPEPQNDPAQRIGQPGRGIQTDLFAIERYVEEIYQEVLGKSSSI